MTSSFAPLTKTIADRLRAPKANGLVERLRRRLGPLEGSAAEVDLVVGGSAADSRWLGGGLGQVLTEAPAYVSLQGVEGALDDGVAEYRLRQGGLSRCEIAQFAAERLGAWRVRRILAAPSTADEAALALEARASTLAPLIVWVSEPERDEALTGELWRTAEVRFATSGALRDRLVAIHGAEGRVLPPMVDAALIRRSLLNPRPVGVEGSRAVMVGAPSRQAGLDVALTTLAGAGLLIEWLVRTSEFQELALDAARLAAAGIVIRTPTSPSVLAARVEAAEVTVVLGPSVGSPAADRLRLPPALPFLTAAAGTPILVLSDGPSAAADFVVQLGLGEVVPYRADLIAQAAQRMAQPEAQALHRARAFALGGLFDATGAYARLTGGEDRFGPLFPPLAG